MRFNHPKILKDTFGRVHDYLRISLTDRCNFKCFYCMPLGNYQCMPSSKMMTAQEVYELAKIFKEDYGSKKIRLTGGEPLMRKDFHEILTNLSRLELPLYLTTNGYFLDKYAELIREVGLKDINISIDSLNKEKFKTITQRDSFQRVWRNIMDYLNNGFHIKLNVVIVRGINDEEIADFLALTMKYPVEVRFIEFMPFSQNQWNRDKVVPIKKMHEMVAQNFQYFKLENGLHDTSSKCKIEGSLGSFGFISSLSQSFCAGCNRIRLTADGKIKNCLFASEEFDVLSAYRSNADVGAMIEQAIYLKHKEKGGQFTTLNQINESQIQNRCMVGIGG